MAVKYAVGTDGSVTLPTGHAMRVDFWSGTFSRRVINITGFDSSGFEENQGALKSAAGSCTGTPKYDAASTAPGFAAATAQVGSSATFQVATGCTYAGATIISDIAPSVDVNGAARITMNWRMTGTITETWDETP